VAWFYVRAHRRARRSADRFALVAPTRPKDLATLLKIAKGKRYVVELGTGSAWTSIALLLTDRDREVISYDPVVQGDREGYLSLAAPDVRARLSLRAARAEAGPEQRDPPVELLFIDIGGHSRGDTAAAFLAWRDRCGPEGVVVFHDFGPRFPGVPMAIAQLALKGTVVGESMFVWNIADGLLGKAG
jgi:hypothetical protein